jgi:hypothetical protein
MNNKRINNEYSHGKFNEYKVIIMNKNGYINATKLCSCMDKQFRQWNRSYHSELSMKSIHAETNIKPDKLQILIKAACDKKVTGTYVYPNEKRIRIFSNCGRLW